MNYDFVTQRVGLVEEEGIMTSAYIAIRPKVELNNKFYCYFFKTLDAHKMFHGMGSGIRLTLSYDDLKSYLLPLPPLSEQNQIAKFLDEKISKINKLISIRQQEISELRELKKAIINKAVTKGDWKRVRLKNIIVNRDGGAWGDEPCNGANDRVCMRVADFDFHNGRLKKRNIYTIRSYSNLQINQLILKYGDILVEKSGGGDRTPVGRAVMFDLDCPALFANFMDRLRVNKNFITPKFFEYCWMSMYFLGTTTHYIKQTTGIQNLDITVLLSRELIPLPPLSEQNEIADYLDKKCSQIDALITNHEKQITELNDLKARLISDAVTGKIDVR